MSASEYRGLLDQLAEAGTFFLTFSGGEPLLHPDLFEIVAHARDRAFCVKLKTNASLIGQREADRIRALGINEVHVSVYSHRPEAHDAVTLVPGSFERSLHAVRLLRSLGQKVVVAHIATRLASGDDAGVRALAGELGAGFRIDPTITPKIDGDSSPLALNVPHSELVRIVTSPEYVGNVEEFCETPKPPDPAALNEILCGAGHNHCYIAPDGEVFPCVQFPVSCGSVRRQRFLEIWRHSPAMNEVRAVRVRDLPVCSQCSHIANCSRCPGLALMDGDVRGPSLQDCEKSWARTSLVPTGCPVPLDRTA
jgi:radical SAM protein with 4Fe4S-binding SPASM domain